MSEVFDYSSLYWEGLRVTVILTVAGTLLTLVIAFAVGLARLSQHRILRAPSYVFVEFFRGTSLVVQLFWVYYALPFLGIKLDDYVAGVLVLGLNEGAYAAEVVRSAIVSRPRGQTEAAIALGLSPSQRMRRILLPQAIPVMLPSFGNVAVDLLKATSLVSFIAIADLTFNGLAVRTETQQTGIIFGGLLVTYFLLSSMLALLTRWLEARFSTTRSTIKKPLFAPALEGGAGPGGVA